MDGIIKTCYKHLQTNVYRSTPSFDCRKAPLRLAERLLPQPLPLEQQLRLVVFLDQQSRNERATSDESAAEVEEFIKRCSTLARKLADEILKCGDCEAILKATGASHAQFCFFTLVLRHTQKLEDVAVAQRLLQELQKLSCSDVVKAFLKYNSEALLRLESCAYAQEAIAQHFPERLCYSEKPAFAGCLAPRCLGEDWQRLAWLQPGCWSRFTKHPLVQELRESLERQGLMDGHVLLSYSGGVDSTAHLLLLLALRESLPCAPSISCLLLSYPNRDADEVEAEKQWAAWVCHQLGVELYVYEVRLARPHGVDGVDEVFGVTREEYERWTKEIRFRMYRCLLAPYQGPKAVILGHHQDDVDENRLDHLMKGHVLGDVEGMWSWRYIHDVQLFRPLLQRRKADFVSILEEFPTPHFRDSTPGWSVRGSTRAALDSLDSAMRKELVEALQGFGSLSREVGEELDKAIQMWASSCTYQLQLPRGATGVALDLKALLGLQVGHRLIEVKDLISRIREIWNPLVTKVLTTIPETLSDIPGLLFEKGFFAAASDLVSKRPGHYHTSDTLSVNRKAVRHLYENIRACQKPQFAGGLTQEPLDFGVWDDLGVFNVAVGSDTGC